RVDVRRAFHDRPRALDLLEQPLLGELAQGLAHGDARHGELLGELALARQRVAMAELSADDEAPHAAVELKIERKRQLAGQGVLVETSRVAHAWLPARGTLA